MRIRFNCPTTGCVALIELQPFEECGGVIRCPRCGVEHAVQVTEAMRLRKAIDRCAVCGGAELFVRKDFPQRLGLLIVVIAGVLSVIYFTIDLRIAYGILAAAVGIDLVLYFLTGKVTCCYRCRAEYRNVTPNPAHEGFDLATSEKY